MYRNLPVGPAAAIVGALFVLGVAGCSSDSTGMSNETLTQAEANDVGQEVQAQVASVVGASTIVGIMKVEKHTAEPASDERRVASRSPWVQFAVLREFAANTECRKLMLAAIARGLRCSIGYTGQGLKKTRWRK